MPSRNHRSPSEPRSPRRHRHNHRYHHCRDHCHHCRRERRVRFQSPKSESASSDDSDASDTSARSAASDVVTLPHQPQVPASAWSPPILSQNGRYQWQARPNPDGTIQYAISGAAAGADPRGLCRSTFTNYYGVQTLPTQQPAGPTLRGGHQDAPRHPLPRRAEHFDDDNDHGRHSHRHRHHPSRPRQTHHASRDRHHDHHHTRRHDARDHDRHGSRHGPPYERYSEPRTTYIVILDDP
ncbi:hypothetical protein F5Y18DRAFT_250181 [Xylariaceae sp. FL1019]|nr:hypothetical protein F5Y18DRAFT_250181 [Xylariaceae sp. FL1019]